MRKKQLKSDNYDELDIITIILVILILLTFIIFSVSIVLITQPSYFAIDKDIISPEVFDIRY